MNYNNYYINSYNKSDLKIYKYINTVLISLTHSLLFLNQNIKTNPYK